MRDALGTISCAGNLEKMKMEPERIINGVRTVMLQLSFSMEEETVIGGTIGDFVKLLMELDTQQQLSSH